MPEISDDELKILRDAAAAAASNTKDADAWRTYQASQAKRIETITASLPEADRQALAGIGDVSARAQLATSLLAKSAGGGGGGGGGVGPGGTPPMGGAYDDVEALALSGNFEKLQQMKTSNDPRYTEWLSKKAKASLERNKKAPWF
jgi:hypothetical protein